MLIDGEEVLPGGVGNAGAVVRIGDEVRRPASPHTPAIHALLRHLESVGFDGAPRVLGFDADGRERLRLIPGDVPILPFPAWSRTDAALASTAALIRRFHDATAGFVPPPDTTWSEEIADPAGPGAAEVICHNDVCPENVVFRNGEAVALLDFEFAAPGRRVYDLACFAVMWIPIEAPEDAARTGRAGFDPFRRIRVIADAYGLSGNERERFGEVVEERIEQGGAFVLRRVAAAEAAFVEMLEQMGGPERFERRRAWFRANRDRFAAALAG